MNLADNIKKIRKENNLSQEQLADKLNVSRQSVSKWESGLAYPEMDKVLQICQIFNLNIDDLMNQDIKEVNNRKAEKNNLNKYFDDFLSYITKTIDMFGNMKFKDKIKCLFEELVILGVISILLLIIGGICETIFNRLFNFMPWRAYHVIYDIFASLYLIFAVVFGAILIVHIFKIRYLDYYVIVKENNDDVLKDDKKNEDSDIKENNKKIVLSKKQEKIIIRDPEHSSYKFINGLFSMILFIIKVCAAFILAFFAFTLVCLCICLVLSFMIVKSGMLFAGLFIIIITSIIINMLILIRLYYFIISKKVKRTKFAFVFLISLVVCGIGIGLLLQGLSNFDYMCGYESESKLINSYEFDMSDDLYIDSWYNIEFVESDNNNVKIEVMTSNQYEITVFKSGNGIYLNYNYDDNFNNILKTYINDINSKKYIDYTCHKIKIYTNRNNIDKLKTNRYKYY